VAALVVAPGQARSWLGGAATIGIGLAGLVAGVAALRGHSYQVRLPGLLPLAGVQVALDPLGGWFIAVTGGVLAAAALYGIGYARHGTSGRGGSAALPVFATTPLLGAAAGGVSTLLGFWGLVGPTPRLLG